MGDVSYRSLPLEDFRDAFETRGLRFTRQREAVVRALLECDHTHLSAEEITEKVRAEAPDLGQATVYRTLAVLEDMGLVRSTDFGDGKARYEISDKAVHHHHHLICISCGRVEEVEHDLLQQIEDHVETRHGFVVINHSLKLYGVCKACRHDAKPPNSDRRC